MKKSNKFPCKCKVCGIGEIEEMYDVCPYCGWEEDVSQEEDGNCIYGPNKMSLNQYKQFWEENKECILKTLKENPFIWMELSQDYYERYFKKINEKQIALEENEN